MRSRKQPKIHKYSRRKKRRTISPGRTFLSVCFTFLMAGAIGVVGYSIAKPILQYEPSPVTPTTTADNANMTSILETTQALVSEELVSTTEMATVPHSQVQTGVVLAASALMDETTFRQALQQARAQQPAGTLLVLPLKVSGGAVLYQTKSTLAQTCGAAQGTLSLAEMVTAAQDAGFSPVAQVSLLADNLLPDAEPEAGFLVTDGSRWLDNSQENGGKPWVSPFSEVTIQYLTELVQEVAASGMTQIWCTDVTFPAFRSSDLDYIGQSVQRDDRNMVLIQLTNDMTEAAGTVPVYLEVSAARLAAGTEEVFVPQQLTISGVVLDCDEADELMIQMALETMREMQQTQPMWMMVNVTTSVDVRALREEYAKTIPLLGIVSTTNETE